MDLGFASRQEGMTLEWVRLRDDRSRRDLAPHGIEGDITPVSAWEDGIRCAESA